MVCRQLEELGRGLSAMREERIQLEASLARLTAEVQEVHGSQSAAEKRLSATESSAAEAAAKFEQAQRDCQALIDEVTRLSVERDRLSEETAGQRRGLQEQRETLVSELTALRSEQDRQAREQRAEWERQQRTDIEALQKMRTEAQVGPRGGEVLRSTLSAKLFPCLIHESRSSINPRYLHMAMRASGALSRSRPSAAVRRRRPW